MAEAFIHCLAGAHRAGSAGVACLMHLEGLGLAAAIAKAQAARPLIDPIHYLHYLLSQLEQAMGRAAGENNQKDSARCSLMTGDSCDSDPSGSFQKLLSFVSVLFVHCAILPVTRASRPGTPGHIVFEASHVMSFAS